LLLSRPQFSALRLSLVAALISLPLAASAQIVDWATPAEKTDYRTTPTYPETMAFIERVAAAAPTQVKVEPFGTTGENRTLNLVIVSKDGVFDPAAIHAAHRPILLVQNGIHAGEMDGKDSCLALLRDMVITKSQAALLDRAVFIFIPVYNIDGHERRSPYNRINQNGPEVMGWRGNGTNLNLNRDYLKADAPETRAFMAMFHRWLPDFFVDDHVTDGADFQYDVTYTMDDTPDVQPATAAWIRDTARSYVEKYVDAHGHLASSTYVNLVDDTNPAKGLSFNNDPPRFSTGYMILEGRPAMLVELHMLKDYKTRVTGNYEVLAGLLQLINRDADKLIALNQQSDAEAESLGAHPLANTQFPLAVDWDGQTTTPFLFHGYKYTRELSAVSGSMWIRYSHDPADTVLPFQTGAKIAASVAPPAAYIIPAQWTNVIDVLAAHQVVIRRTTADWTGNVDSYRCSGMTWQGPPFEGRHPIFAGEGAGSQPGKFGQCLLEKRPIFFPKGSAVVELNQRLSRVAIQWLEPLGPDSAMRWNFFDPTFEQREYGEFYVLEKLAREQMEKDPKLKAEFEHKIESDPQFAANPYARLEFFYDRSPWYDANRVGLYPVGRLLNLDGVPLAPTTP
jgi:murein tripeptide amidase MpaA